MSDIRGEQARWNERRENWGLGKKGRVDRRYQERVTKQMKRRDKDCSFTWNDYESSTNTDIPRDLQACQQQPRSMQQHDLDYIAVSSSPT